MALIIYFLTFVGVILVVFAYYPRIKHYYRISKLRPPGSPLYAEGAWKGTEMSIRFTATKYCVIFNHLFLKKSVLLAVAYSVMLLSLTVIIVKCPVDMPLLLNVVVYSYVWVSLFCYLLLKFIRRAKLSITASMTLAALLPLLIFMHLYPCAKLIRSLYV